MKLMNFFKKFHNDESGAVTVDWVVLTAAIVGLGIVVMGTVETGVNTAASTMTTDLDTAVAGANP